MKTHTVALLVIAALYPITVFGQNPPGFETMVNTLLKGTVPTLTSDELHKQLSAKSTTPVLLDARSEAEYNISHLNGARFVGYDDFELGRVSDIDKSAPVVVYCSVGKRSEDIAQRLIDAGFTQVKNHRGGIFDWSNRGYPVVNNKGQEVNIVHPYNRIWGVWVNRCEKAYEPR
jgi:rhodanese-related sulfurtransferase